MSNTTRKDEITLQLKLRPAREDDFLRLVDGQKVYLYGKIYFTRPEPERLVPMILVNSDTARRTFKYCWQAGVIYVINDEGPLGLPINIDTPH